MALICRAQDWQAGSGALALLLSTTTGEDGITPFKGPQHIVSPLSRCMLPGGAAGGLPSPSPTLPRFGKDPVVQVVLTCVSPTCRWQGQVPLEGPFHAPQHASPTCLGILLFYMTPFQLQPEPESLTLPCRFHALHLTILLENAHALLAFPQGSLVPRFPKDGPGSPPTTPCTPPPPPAQWTSALVLSLEPLLCKVEVYSLTPQITLLSCLSPPPLSYLGSWPFSHSSAPY